MKKKHAICAEWENEGIWNKAWTYLFYLRISRAVMLKMELLAYNYGQGGDFPNKLLKS